MANAGLSSSVDPVAASLALRASVEPWGRKARRGFTLIELLITISIIALMASMVLFALYSAQETAKVAKTKALIAKLDSIVKAKWESYRTRRVPITIPAGTLPQTAAKMRLDALRDLMRMEMPDRWTDVIDNPVTPFGAGTFITRPAVSQGYLRKYNLAHTANMNNPTVENQYAECLYLIVMSAIAEEGDAREVFRPDDVKDVDGDGFPEFVDAWGQPIRFLRWAPGFQSELQIIARGTSIKVTPDPTNPQLVTISATGAGLSAAPGAYVGGAYIELDKAGQLEPKEIGRITGYSNPAGTPTFTFQTYPGPPTNTQQPPFQTSPTSGYSFVVMAPDPFDPSGVYPIYSPGAMTPPSPDTSVPTFALYPLIYSAGPNRCYGVISDTSPIGLSYSTAALNPFYKDSGGVMMGLQQDITGEPNFVPSGWLDNIHNHMLGTK